VFLCYNDPTPKAVDLVGPAMPKHQIKHIRAALKFAEEQGVDDKEVGSAVMRKA
jgi:hypothetical protein